MTKIVHEFCGICICFSGVWGGGLRFGEESCLCIAARLRGIACSWWGRVAGSNHSPPVRRRVNRGTSYLRAKCRLLRLRSETRLRAQRSALRLFLHRALRDCAAIAAQAKKTAAVKGNGCRAPCSLSGFLHHKTPCGKYLRKKYHTMVLPVTQV